MSLHLDCPPWLICLEKIKVRVQLSGPYRYGDLREATSGQDNSAAGGVYWLIKVQALAWGPYANEALQLTGQITSSL